MKKRLISMITALAVMLPVAVPLYAAAEKPAVDETALQGTSGSLDYEQTDGGVIITGCDINAESVEIPAEIDGMSVVGIHNSAFFNCDKLASVKIPGSVKSIGDSAFNSCSALTEITIPGSVKSIGDGAFKHCESLTTAVIEDGVESIGSDAFYECSNLTSVTIPESITRIGSSAFGRTAYYNDESNWENGALYAGKCLIDSNPETLPEDYVIKGGTVFIGDRVFYRCDGLTSITIPESVTYIGDSAFYDCNGLTGVTIPDGVTYIGDSAFCYCSGLTSITIPESVTHISYMAFGGCTALTEITISSSIEEILDYTFSGCTALTSVTIPDGVKRIGQGAFEDCESLESITLPDSIESIEREAFYGTAYYNNDVNWENGALYIGKNLIKLENDQNVYAVKEGTRVIGGETFRNRSRLKSVTIPSSLIGIGSYAFKGCESLESVNVDANNTVYSSEGGILFNKDKTELIYCPNMGRTSFEISANVASIDDNAFDDCIELTSINVDAGNMVYSSEDGILFNADKTELIYCPKGKEGSYTIPDGVTSIGKNAFESCGLTSVTISDGVTSIGNYAFGTSESLTSVIIPTSVETIAENAFNYCKNLTDIYYTGSSSDWRWIDMGDLDEKLTATVHYNYGKATPEPTPTATATVEPTATATAEPTPTATAEPTPTATPKPNYSVEIIGCEQADGKYTIKLKASNAAYKGITCTIYAAIYSSNGALKACIKAEVKIEPENNKAADIVLQCAAETGDTVKAFMWDNQKPLSEAAQADVL